MFCINCFYHSTAVINSRPNKKEPVVWRRRHCIKCNTTFTTRERPSLTDSTEVKLPSGDKELFSLGKLALSIAKSFTHSSKDAEYSSLPLAQTIETTLASQREVITPCDIEATTHSVLKRYDELAAMQYAAQHQLISSVRRRGRPSLV